MVGQVIPDVMGVSSVCFTCTEQCMQVWRVNCKYSCFVSRIKGVTLRDKVKSMDIRKELGVNSIKEKVREMRLCWYGHMQRMEENNEVRVVVDVRVPGKRPRGRPRGRWMDRVQRDMQELRITLEDDQDRTFWKSRILAADPT